MKKLLALILTVALLLPVLALADLPDVTGMTDQELRDLISACSAELRARAAYDQEGILIFEYDQFRVYQTDEAYVDSLGFLCVPVVVINDMDHEMVLSAENAICNGWDIFAGNCRASGKTKNEDKLIFKIADANLKKIEQIDSLTFYWEVIDFTDLEFVYTQEEPEEHRFW